MFLTNLTSPNSTTVYYTQTKNTLRKKYIDLLICVDVIPSIIISSSNFDFYTPKIVYSILFSLYYSTDLQIFAFKCPIQFFQFCSLLRVLVLILLVLYWYQYLLQ